MNALAMTIGSIVGIIVFLLLNWIEDSPKWQRIEQRLTDYKSRITIRR